MRLKHPFLNKFSLSVLFILLFKLNGYTQIKEIRSCIACILTNSKERDNFLDYMGLEYTYSGPDAYSRTSSYRISKGNFYMQLNYQENLNRIWFNLEDSDSSLMVLMPFLKDKWNITDNHLVDTTQIKGSNFILSNDKYKGVTSFYMQFMDSDDMEIQVIWSFKKKQPAKLTHVEFKVSTTKRSCDNVCYENRTPPPLNFDNNLDINDPSTYWRALGMPLTKAQIDIMEKDYNWFSTVNTIRSYNRGYTFQFYHWKTKKNKAGEDGFIIYSVIYKLQSADSALIPLGFTSDTSKLAVNYGKENYGRIYTKPIAQTEIFGGYIDTNKLTRFFVRGRLDKDLTKYDLIELKAIVPETFVFEDDRPLEKWMVKTGCLNGDCMNSEGTYQYINGDQFTGLFDDRGHPKVGMYYDAIKNTYKKIDRPKEKDRVVALMKAEKQKRHDDLIPMIEAWGRCPNDIIQATEHSFEESKKYLTQGYKNKDEYLTDVRGTIDFMIGECKNINKKSDELKTYCDDFLPKFNDYERFVKIHSLTNELEVLVNNFRRDVNFMFDGDRYSNYLKRYYTPIYDLCKEVHSEMKLAVDGIIAARKTESSTSVQEFKKLIDELHEDWLNELEETQEKK